MLRRFCASFPRMTDTVTVPRDGQDASAPTVPTRPARGWLRAGERAPQTRRRRPLVRLLLALSSGTALIGVVGVVAAAAFVPPIGARRAARALADRELRAQLRPTEQVVARVFASQRRWTDMYRESFGVVAATSQRVLYVGAPPMPLLRPREDGPEELLVESYPYDAAFTLEPTTMFRGLARGLALRTPDATVGFLVDDRAWPDAVAVSRASGDARRAVTQNDAAFAESYRAPLPSATVYVTHIVQRGETLTSLARRFGTSPDVLRQLNQLPTDNIRSGQRLRVPRVDDVP
jgi:hypothetical protein